MVTMHRSERGCGARTPMGWCAGVRRRSYAVASRLCAGEGAASNSSLCTIPAPSGMMPPPPTLGDGSFGVRPARSGPSPEAFVLVVIFGEGSHSHAQSRSVIGRVCRAIPLCTRQGVLFG